MKRTPPTTKIFLTVLILFILSCGPVGSPPLTTPDNDSPETPVASLTETPASTLTPTALPTATVYPPIFDPALIGDNRVLESFVLQKTEIIHSTIEDGKWWDSIGYVQASTSAYHTGGFSFSGETYETDSRYLIDGGQYTKDGQNGPPFYYYFHPVPDPEELDFQLLGAADMRQGDIMLSQFMGEEDYVGIPAYHFTVDESNISPGEANYTGVVKKANGDLYLAQQGNYLLYFHINMSGNEGSRELTEELTSINQLTAIALPDDFPLFELAPGFPFPADSIMHSIQTDESLDFDYYDYFVPEAVSYGDFLDFYKNLPAASGWTVSSIDKITGKYYCEGQDCVTLEKGNARLILSKPDLCVSTMPAGYYCIGADYYR